ncbi:MAG: CHAT domain-containing protein, partial [Pseudomonadota bacterium]
KRFDAGLIARGQTALLLGQAYLETDAAAAADAELEHAEALFREARYALGLALALESRALAALRLGDHAGVEKLAREAIDVYSVLRGRLTNLDLRANYASQQFRPANVYVKSLMQRHVADPDAGYDARALEVAERARARTLLEVLNDSDADRSGASPRILARRSRLLREISANAEPTLPSGARSRGDLIELLSELDELESRIVEQTRPEFGRIADIDLSVEEVQAALGPGELLLYYFIGDDEVFAWAVSAGTADGLSLGESRVIEQAAQTTAKGLRELDSVEAGLEQLSRLVLGPFAPAMEGASRIVIVTDGALNYVPFEALPVPGARTRLLNDFVVSYAPSVATLSVLRAAAAGHEREPLVLAVSDPVFSLRDRRIEPGESSDDERRGGQPLNRLALTALEADAIEALVPDGRLLDLAGLEANRGTLLEALTTKQPDIVHIATHGFVDTDRPELTGISLSIDPAAAAMGPSFIGLRDIYLLNLSARLVVLSACETALGRELKSEGLVGLTRAFLYAGARQVIASLWQVQDRSTSELMRRLYSGYLSDGLDAAEALRAAKLEVRANPRWRHPYYWSGFVLQGH